MKQSKTHTIKQVISFSIMVFLLLYHSIKSFYYIEGIGEFHSTDFINSFESDFPLAYILALQFALRLAIVIGLVLVFYRKKSGLFCMWTGIVLLVITQFILVAQTTYLPLQELHNGIRPLKGLILPSMVTLLYPYKLK